MSKYLHVIKTKAYQNDSRLLKWIEALRKQNQTSSVYILEDANVPGESIQDDMRITKSFLYSRKFFKKGKGFIFKVPEFSLKSLRYIKRSKSECVVFHDLQHYFTLFLLCLNKPKHKKIIWDLHELFHEPLLKFWFSRKALEFILNRVDCIVYTNESRRDYTLGKLNYTEKNYVILNNYTDNSYLKERINKIPARAERWLAHEKYIIWLGGGFKGRNFINFLKAYSRMSNDFKLIMLGRADDDAKRFIKENDLESRIYETFVKPTEMLSYIDNAEFSVVLYKHISPNNYYCEPNRLYQLTSRGIPIIVGNNPQMKSLVLKYQAGLVLDDDGSNVDQLYFNMEKIKKKLSVYKKNLKEKRVAKDLSWENQFDKIFQKLSAI